MKMLSGLKLTDASINTMDSSLLNFKSIFIGDSPVVSNIMLDVDRLLPAQCPLKTVALSREVNTSTFEKAKHIMNDISQFESIIFR